MSQLCALQVAAILLVIPLSISCGDDDDLSSAYTTTDLAELDLVTILPGDAVILSRADQEAFRNVFGSIEAAIRVLVRTDLSASEVIALYEVQLSQRSWLTLPLAAGSPYVEVEAWSKDDFRIQVSVLDRNHPDFASPHAQEYWAGESSTVYRLTLAAQGRKGD